MSDLGVSKLRYPSYRLSKARSTEGRTVVGTEGALTYVRPREDVARFWYRKGAHSYWCVYPVTIGSKLQS